MKRNRLPSGHLENRRRRIREKLQQSALDAFVTQHLPNIRYASLFTGSTGMAVYTAADQPWLLIDPRYSTQARSEVRGFHIRECKGGLERAAADLLREIECRRVAYEPRRISTAAFNTMIRQAPGKVEWVEADDLLDRLRALKDPHELAVLRRAAKLTCELCDVIMRCLVPGARESDIAAELGYQAIQKGASGTSFETIVASGRRSALPHGIAARKRLRCNEFVVVDFGIVLDGYCSDMTRTFYLGNPRPREKRIYRAVCEALEAAEAVIQHGTPASKADRQARETLRRSRLDRYFTHSTGHGLGLEVHEFPGLRRDSKDILAEGMVVTVEPGVYIPDWGGVRIEDMVAIQNQGCEVLTPFTHELISL